MSWAKDLSAKPFDEKNQKVRCVLGQSKIYKLDIALVRGRPTIWVCKLFVEKKNQKVRCVFGQ